MIDIKCVLENTENVRDNLIMLNSAYDEIFKPWIPVQSNIGQDQVNEHRDCDYDEKNLSLLYKLQNVLIKASNAKEKSEKQSDKCGNEAARAKPAVRAAASASRAPHRVSALPARHIAVAVSEAVPKPRFIPAHRTAPFRTDPVNVQRQRRRRRDGESAATAASGGGSSSASNVSRSHRSATAAQMQRCNTEHNIGHRESQRDHSKDHSKDRSNTQKLPPPQQLNADRHPIESVSDAGPIADCDGAVDVAHILSQLKAELAKVRDNVAPVDQTPAPPAVVWTTIAEAGEDALQMPVAARRLCRAYCKAQSNLGAIYLKSMKSDATSAAERARKRFTDQSLASTARRLAWETHRVRTVHEVLERVATLAGMLDLESCNRVQVGFIQGCLSWVLKEYLDMQQTHQTLKQSKYKSPKTPQCREILEIRKWLDDKHQDRKSSNELDKCTLQAAYVTNCPFITCIDSKMNQPISLAVRNTCHSPFRFSIGGDVLSHSPGWESVTRPLIIQQQLQLCWIPLIGKWIQMFKEKHKNNQGVASSYRQIYGLLVGKYPVILQDLS